MRKIAVVGSGQAGLPLALGLLANGFDVTVATNRTPDDIRNGRVMSSQCMFDASLQIERDLGLNQWEDACPTVDGIGLAVPNPDAPHEKLIDWSARLQRPAQAVDQRIKMPAWLQQFERQGGRLLIEDVGIPELERLAKENELVIAAAGKSEIVKLFERDAIRSAFDKPQRALALTYVNGLRPAQEYSRVAFNLIPGVGEYFVFPALTTSGPCDIMVFEGVPGGPMDCWRDIATPQAHLAQSLALLRTFLPWEAERAAHVELTDANGILAGSFAPTVRRPVATLPSGKMVFGLGDAVMLNDPITGQGSNNATKAARIYLDAILAHGDQPYSLEWMQRTFERFWVYGEQVVAWTNSLLRPPPPHVLNMLGAAGNCPSLASAVANGFNNPPDYFPWWFDAEACEQFVALHMANASRAAA
ncbi:styrene monooxygenase/indole monooxygenase family protein [Pseudoduganella sp. R-31]|uniref:styrene monooxygenase/indole monooxygenase family protein n=1 Tax=unclassified Pseudoduganella TaxID=2637179 RepID=UPI003CF5D1CF